MDVIADNLDSYVGGIAVTLWLSVLSFLLAVVIGVVVATFRVSPLRLLRTLGSVYVEVFFSLPLLVWALLFFFGLPKVGIAYPPFTSAVIVLGTFTGALVGEALRSGINTVPSGQGEAARAVGLRFWQVLGLVVLPQALRTMIGPLGSILLALVRNSAVAAIAMSVDDLMWRSDQLATSTAQPVAVLAGTFVAYLILTVPGTWLVNTLARRYRFTR